MKFCTSCGKELKDNAKFCSGCGAKCIAIVPETAAPIVTTPEVVAPVADAPEVVVPVAADPEIAAPAVATPEVKTAPIKETVPAVEPIPVKQEVKAEPVAVPMEKSPIQAEAKKTVPVDRQVTYAAKQEKNNPTANNAPVYAEQVYAAENQQSANNAAAAPKKKRVLPIIIAAVLSIAILAGAGIFAVPKLMALLSDRPSDETANKPSTDSNISFFGNDEEDEIAAIIAEADVLAAAEDYEGAIAEVKAGQATYPADEELQKKLEEYIAAQNAQIKQTNLDEAKKLADAGDYVGAMAVIQTALDTYGEDADYRGAYDTYHIANITAIKNEAIGVADKLATSEEYLEALRTINQAITEVGDDETLLALADVYEDCYVTDIATKIEKHIVDDDIEAAKELIHAVADEVADNDTIQEYREELEKYTKVSVRSLTPINSGGSWDTLDVTLENALGETFNDAENFFIPWQDSYGEYYIDGNYTSISGKITSYFHMGEGRISNLQIWADNTIIYNSPKVTQKTKQFAFDVVIPEGTETIKFVCAANGYSYSEMLITDLFFINDPNYYENNPTDSSVAVRSLEPINATGSWLSIPLIMENALGDSFNDSQSFFIPWQDSYGEYYANGKYTKVTGEITSFYHMQEGRECYLQIIADDVVIYTSPTVDQTTEQFDFDVSIPEGTQFVKFICKANGYSFSEILITNLYFWE